MTLICNKSIHINILIKVPKYRGANILEIRENIRGIMGWAQTGILDRYKRLLWWSLEQLRVTESVTRKMMAAVTLQFIATIALFALPMVFLGADVFTAFPPEQIAMTVVVFALAVIAYINTLLIVQEDMAQPLADLETTATKIAGGEISEDPPKSTQTDEIGMLIRSFNEMHTYLATVVGQSKALSNEEFDAAVLDEDVPGGLGTALQELQESLEDRISELKSQREATERRRQALEADAERFTEAFERCGSGDLTARVSAQSDSTAMQDIVTTFNEMMDTLEEAVVHIREIGHEVDDASIEIGESVADAMEASETVATTVDEIAAGAERQDKYIQNVSEEMADLSATIQEIASSTEQVAETSQATAQLGSEAADQAQTAATEIATIQRQTDQTLEEITALKREVDRIGQIADLIDEFAEQTNMLALNASIEAAHADEAGDGFAVVAQQIKALAEETKGATDDIEEVISDIEAATDEVVADMRGTRDSVESGVETVEETVEMLDRIVDRVAQIDDQIQAVSEATDEQASSTQQTVSMVEEIGTISHQTARQAEEVDQTTQHQLRTISDVEKTKEALGNRATDLRRVLDVFDVNGDAIDRGAAAFIHEPEIALE